MVENIEIRVQDRVTTTISTKLTAIGTSARNAHTAIERLQAALSRLNANALNVITQGASAAAKALNQTTLAAQKLATEQQRTAAAAAQAAAAQTRANTAIINGEAAMQRLAAAQQRTIAATAQASAAQTRANTAITQGQTATMNLAAATTRANTAQVQGATAAQRLANEQARAGREASNAAAAADRAALAALRLKQAQDEAAAAARGGSGALAGYARAAAGIVGIGLSTNALVKAGDAYTNLQNRLQNVTTSQEQVNELTGRLFDLAAQTGTSIDSTAMAFSRFDRSLRTMGKSQEDTLRLTETVNKALLISGATAGESASALLQLSQAFNSGRLQGDEFRAVAENMPTVLDAVAKALDVPINRVKEMASEGKITSEVLFNAFGIMQESVDSIFGRTSVTVERALSILGTRVTQFLGELDKATGITASLSSALISLSNNLDIAAAAVAVVGVGVVSYFGSSVVSAVKLATSAVNTFTLALAANPIGLLLVGITAAISALVIFRDRIKVTSDGVVTLGDAALAAFSFIRDGLSTAADFIRTTWNAAIDFINEKTNGWGEQFRNIGEAIGRLVKATVNMYIGAWAGAYSGIKAVWNNFPELMGGFFSAVVNLSATAVETVVNAWQTGLRLLSGAVEAIAPSVGAALTGALDNLNLKLPRIDTSSGKEAADDVIKAFNDAFTRDYVGAGQNAFLARAREIAEQRRAAQGNSPELRGSGPSQLGDPIDQKAIKAAETRALALEKINAQLDNELSRMYQLAPQRQAQAEFDRIEESLIQRRIRLTDSEATAIKTKIAAIQNATDVQREFDSIYNEATGPARQYNATLEAAQRLLDSNVISQERYAQSVLKASEAYNNSQNPMREYNRNLQQQFDLLTMLPRQREVEQQIVQLSNNLLSQGITLNNTELGQLRDRLSLLQQLNDVAQQESSLLGASVDKRKQEIDQLTAINKLLEDRSSGFTQSDAITAIAGSDAGSFLGGSPELVNAQVEQYNQLYSQIDAMRQSDLISEQTAAAAKSQIWAAQQNVQLQSAKTYFTALEGLQYSSNSKMARIGKAAAIANAIVNTYQAATAAYASLASVPIIGPGLGASAAAAAIVAGMANVAAIRSQNTGFKTGGYTGNVGVNEVAGVVHGREFVMDANSTNRIGVDNLQALQNGAAVVQQNNGGDSNARQTGNNSAASPAPTTVNMRNINVLDPALVGEYLATPEGEQVFINTMRRNSDQVRQIIQNV